MLKGSPTCASVSSAVSVCVCTGAVDGTMIGVLRWRLLSTSGDHSIRSSDMSMHFVVAVRPGVWLCLAMCWAQGHLKILVRWAHRGPVPFSAGPIMHCACAVQALGGS